MNRSFQIVAVIALLSSAAAFGNDNGKTSVEAAAKAASDSNGRGEVRGSIEVKSGHRTTGEISVKTEASRSTDGRAEQSAEVKFKKEF